MTKVGASQPDGAEVAPAIVVVDSNRAALETTTAALSRRFAPDWQVFTAGSADAGIRLLKRLINERRDVALVAADLELSDLDGVEFLERSREIHPAAERILLVAMDQRGTRVPFRVLDSLQRATALGRIDSWVNKDGWVSPEEWLYPQIQEKLSSWTRLNRPRHEVFRVVGPRESSRSHELRDTLVRNTIPFGFYPVESPEGIRLVADHGVDTERLPAIVLNDGSVLHQPAIKDIARALGLHTEPSSEVYDLIVLGAGPAGLAAALCGASEGLRTLVIEPHAIGGQAGTSSMIRNYLGFPLGLSGGDLTFRAWQQALFFGASFVFAHKAVDLYVRDGLHAIRLSEDGEAISRAVILAIGVDYRRLDIPSLERFIGMGVFHGAATSEARALEGERVAVVGGANSAGQAALHLAKYAAQVDLLVRAESLAAGMSDYVIAQLESVPNVRVRLHTQVLEGCGRARLEKLTLGDVVTDERDEVDIAAVFVLIGAQPHTGWLPDQVARDEYGSILTDVDVPEDAWPLGRSPLPYETSSPGVFAVGDVRRGSMKRIAGAVGEGSVACASVHRYLREVDAPCTKP
jgi:thioredoxin reductase (NADPH)